MDRLIFCGADLDNIIISQQVNQFELTRIYGHFNILKNMFFEIFSKIRNDRKTKLCFHHHSQLFPPPKTTFS